MPYENNLTLFIGRGLIRSIGEIRLSDKLFKATLIHEMMHTVLGITGLTELLKPEMEEAIIRAFEHSLMDCIKDNIIKALD
jgi:hypothetical protein